MTKYMLLDVSHIAFYKMFALLKWLKLSGKTLTEDEMVDKFHASFIKTVTHLVKTHRVDWRSVVLAMDAPRVSVWRRDIYPLYKGNRDGQRNEHANVVFAELYDRIIPELALNYPVTVVSVDQAEADDIIAVATLVCKADPDASVIIISGDSDFAQLMDSRTHVANCNNILLASECDGNLAKKIKIIMGDKSDNIPTIMPRIGKKRAMALATNKPMLDNLLDSNPGMRDKMMLNTKLIDFQCIPDKIVESIKEGLGRNFASNSCRQVVPWRAHTYFRNSAPPVRERW